jgi:hypothetical protein
MKKVVIAGSAKLQDDIAKWVGYWQGRGFEVADYPVKINPSDFDQEYPKVYKKYFETVLKTDVFFVMNADKNGVKGYIGAETFAELGFVVVNNQLGKTNIEIILLQHTARQSACYEEIELWLKLGWVKLLK